MKNQHDRSQSGVYKFMSGRNMLPELSGEDCQVERAGLSLLFGLLTMCVCVLSLYNILGLVVLGLRGFCDDITSCL